MDRGARWVTVHGVARESDMALVTKQQRTGQKGRTLAKRGNGESNFSWLLQNKARY